MTLVLASRSPQRRAILRQLGVEFVERPVDVVEEDDGVPEAVAGENALRKAVAAGAGEGEIVLGVDTLVATELEIWGKPPNAAAAAETLRRLSGRTHRVVSGVALLRATGDVQAATATHRGHLPHARRRARSSGTSRAASGRAAPAATPSRAAAPR